MEKCIIVAVSNNWAIGKDNKLLWHISRDLQYFKQVTGVCPIIMGRKTYESIGRPLPNRKNIVISQKWADEEQSHKWITENQSPKRGGEKQSSIGKKEQEKQPLGIEIVDNLEDAFAIAEKNVNFAPQSKCFVIGGARVYQDAIDKVSKMYVTHVDVEIDDADTFFPPIDEKKWEIESSSENFIDEKSGLKYRFVVYKKI